MKKKILYIVFGIVLPLFLSSQETGYPIIRNFTPKEYKANPLITCSIQDDRGVMYFGANKLIEYDGVSWRDVYSTTIVRAYDLKKDKNGKIYVAAIDEFGYLALDNKGNTTYVSLTHLLPDPKIKLGILRSIAITTSYIYFQSLEYILQYSPENGKIAVFHAENGDTYNGCFEYKDICYVISTKKGIQKIENNQLISIGQSDFFAHKFFSSALPYNDSTLLVPLATKGIYLFNPEKNENPRKIGEQLNNSFLSDNRLSKGTMLSNGNFVLGSLKKGAALFNPDGQLIQKYNEEGNMSNNYVFSIFYDKSQNLWMNLNNGISKTSQSQDLSYWDKTSGLKNNILSIYRYNGTIYVGTYIKTYYIDNKNKINEVKGMPDGMFWCFFEPTQNKSLLIGTQHGIYQLDHNKKVTPIFKGSHATFLYQSKVNPNRIFSSDDEYFISFRFENSKWKFEGRWNGIKDDIRYLQEDDKGELWVSTFIHGMIRITPDYNNITTPRSVKYYNQNDGIKTLQPISIEKVRNKLVINTADGFYAYNKVADKFEPYCDLGKQFCNGDQDIIYTQEMPDGKIWICPANNQTDDIGYLQPNKKGGYDWIYKPFQRIPHFNIDAMYIEPTGIAWFGGNEGIYRFDLNKDTKDYSQKFNCLIRKVTCGQDSALNIGPDNEKNYAEMAYKFNSMNFEFAAPFFDNEDRTLYSYKLEGFDNNWSEWSRKTEKEYSYLPEGEYKFMVKARNIYDVESSIANYQITILPPFYRTWWAYTLYLILFIALTYYSFKFYTRRLVAQKLQLEQIVATRTAEVSKQKAEILTKNNELEIANATKDKFFSIIAHDLKSPFSSIIGFSEILVTELNELDKEEIEKYTRYILQSSKRALALLMNLMEWAQSQTGRIEFNPAKIDLVNLVNENILLADENARQKSISIEKALPENVTAFADKAMIGTILRNLISNAIKFTQPGGKISISFVEQRGEIIFSIQDTGVGISNVSIEKLFLIDQGFSTSGTNNEIGTGLGLILCKEFVVKHGGKIWVESQQGVGSIFYFSIPKNDMAG